MEWSAVRPLVMVVDDVDENLMVIEAILGDQYDLKFFSDSRDALHYAYTHTPDLILLDVMMPIIDGYEVCRQLKVNAHLVDVPVIFITSKSDVEDEEMGFSVGASDFIHKPISAPIVTARVKTHLKIKFMLDYLKYENLNLRENANQTSSELFALREFIQSSLNR
ncbi:MAG: response regulator [Gallionella sp.]|nr:response regulator [Gallionella sp.]